MKPISSFLVSLALLISFTASDASGLVLKSENIPAVLLPAVVTDANEETQAVTAAHHERLPEELQALIDYFASKGVDLNPYLEDERFQLYDGISRRFTQSAERKTPTLEDYKRILGYDDKRNKIAGFINDNIDELILAEETYDISRYVIAAIIGIESDFGKNIGSYNPFNTYVSMYAEGYRGDFARAQLEELIEFVTRNNIDVFELKSSYAGAMSYAQFIPYSLNRWFVGDDIFDMTNNIHSVANYLAHFKSREGTIEQAVFRYNPSSLYRDAVLSLANDAEALLAVSGAM